MCPLRCYWPCEQHAEQKGPKHTGFLRPHLTRSPEVDGSKLDDPALLVGIYGQFSSLVRERKGESEVALLCLTICDPMDCSPRGSSVLGILQARILEWVAISFSRGSSQPRDRTQVSCIAGRFFTV